MEYILGQNLSETFSLENRLGEEKIRKHMYELFNAVDFLLSKGLCHRDIKVDNIRLRENGELVLLDLGVLKQIGISGGTIDERGKYFLVTLRNSPPEILSGSESDDIDDWKAVNVYKMGTVLGDLAFYKDYMFW